MLVCVAIMSAFGKSLLDSIQQRSLQSIMKANLSEYSKIMVLKPFFLISN
jgi:hypothetical protein